MHLSLYVIHTYAMYSSLHIFYWVGKETTQHLLEVLPALANSEGHTRLTQNVEGCLWVDFTTC